VKIKTLTLHGFKSFADRTEVDLHEGITAIVGPNGCGKSNISDAIRWVLGEQRPTAIRGSRMEEAIFEGTVNRKPIHRAEVEMVLANEDGQLAVPGSEVSIGRTVFRGGESEYRLNGETCRLKDIQDLIRDTGLGANEYSVIENRMIDSILSDRAEERRALFEEAAEISRYKERRRTALRRLDQAEEDLERLEDLLGEVRTKVRSLAQQKGRAEKYEELRDRRLTLEIALGDVRLEDIEERLEEAEEALARIRSSEPAEQGELSRRETEAERLRVEIAEAEDTRDDVASRLDEIRSRAEKTERERLVARERASAAEERLEAIRSELDALEDRRDELEDRRRELDGRLESEREGLHELRRERDEASRQTEARREERDRRKSAEEDAVERLRELRSRIGALEGETEAAAERIEERERELERRRREMEEADVAVDEHRSELEEARSELEETGEHVRELRSELEDAREEVERREGELSESRERLAELEGELSAERERVESLSSLVRSGDEHPAVVAELLESDGRPAGVEGLLADVLDVPERLARPVEAHLGPYLHAVVVKGWDTVREVQRWREGREEADGLILLPVEPGPGEGAPSGGALPEGVDVDGDGEAWVRALLGDVRLEGEDGELRPGRQPWARADGSGQDGLGAVRLGTPGSGQGVLRRRAELRDARSELEEMEARRRRLETELDERREALSESTARRDEKAGALEEAERRERRLQSRRETAEHRLERARGEREEAERRIGELEETLEEAREERRETVDRLEELRREREEAEEEVAEARGELMQAEASLDEASDALQEMELEIARHESEVERARERMESAAGALEELSERRERLEAEAREKRDAIGEARGEAEESQDRVADLLERRSELEEELRDREEELREMRGELEEEEAWLREARKEERQQSERRHELELEIAELRGKRSSIRERIEGEWDEPFEDLRERVAPPEDGGPADWSEELEEVKRDLHRLGPVNLLAAEEYREERERLDFLEEQRDDLLDARDDLHDSIERINEAAAVAFRETFDEVRENFQRTFDTLFQGGDCDVWLEDPDDPLDSAIEISASPGGKKTQRIHLLSGGERALTALALVFGIYLAKPSPFCIMDEVDAPLDEVNVGRFTDMLERFKEDTQFVVITHNPRTIAEADWIYGVTMQEPGVSSVVGVDFEDLATEPGEEEGGGGDAGEGQQVPA